MWVKQIIEITELPMRPPQRDVHVWLTEAGQQLLRSAGKEMKMKRTAANIPECLLTAEDCWICRNSQVEKAVRKRILGCQGLDEARDRCQGDGMPSRLSGNRGSMNQTSQLPDSCQGQCSSIDRKRQPHRLPSAAFVVNSEVKSEAICSLQDLPMKYTGKS